MELRLGSVSTRSALLEVAGLKVHFPLPARFGSRKTGAVLAVDGVSFSIRSGEVLGLVGESGSGKTSVARAVLRLCDITAGRVMLLGQEITSLNERQMRPLRRYIQVVLQDPYDSLNPNMTIGDIVAEPLLVHRLVSDNQERIQRVSELLDRVGMDPSMKEQFPGELSGGQRQRVSIARALAPDPRVLICDEPTSALDVSIQAEVLSVLQHLMDGGLSMLFITHDLGVAYQIADRVAVMYAGRIVEIGTRDTVLSSPRHPYAQALVASVPGRRAVSQHQTQRISLRGEQASATKVPLHGCRFHPRCIYAREVCTDNEPPLEGDSDTDAVACHFWRELEQDRQLPHASK